MKRFVSTRGGIPPVSFQEAILSGYAPDGGLYIPEQIPTITNAQLKIWANLTYPELAKEVVRLFVSEEEISMLDLTG